MENKENAAATEPKPEETTKKGGEDKKDKKMSKEERIAARNQQATKQADTGAAEDDFAKEFYGNFPLIQSKEKFDRELVNIGELDASKVDQKVWIRGRLFTSRKTTSK